MKLPNKLPAVRGQSAIGKMFRMTWTTINELIDHSRSTELKSSPNSLVHRTPHGTTQTTNPTGVEESRTGDGDARWS